jgi:hypothetical protein
MERNPYLGPIFLDAFTGSNDGTACFDDIAYAAIGTGAHISDVGTWLSDACRDGLVQSQGFVRDATGKLGPQRFTLTVEGRRMASADRAQRFTTSRSS